MRGLEAKFAGFARVVGWAEDVDGGDLVVAELWVEMGTEVAGGEDAERGF